MKKMIEFISDTKFLLSSFISQQIVLLEVGWVDVEDRLNRLNELNGLLKHPY